MGDGTGISWTDATWNPVRGCARVSEGCRNCYAEAQAARIVRMGKGKPTPYDGLVTVRSKASGLRYEDPNAAGSWDHPRWTGEVRLVPGMLGWPLRKRKPLRIFVNSMSDIFHEKLTNEQIAAVFGVMAAAPHHTFQTLTKRAGRMREWFEWIAERARTHESEVREIDVVINAAETALSEDDRHGVWATATRPLDFSEHIAWPLPNVWLGVSIENQAAAERIPELINTPAAVRLLSIEPMLGPVDLEPWFWKLAAEGFAWPSGESRGEEYEARNDLHWIIAGCESVPGARPADVAWFRSLRDQCAAAAVPFFLKQARDIGIKEITVYRKKAGDVILPSIWAGAGSKRKRDGVIELPYLDGVQHAAFPEVRP